VTTWVMLQKLGATKAAIACCDEALKIYPDHVKALYKRSLLYLKRGDPDAAFADMSKAHQSEPTNDAVIRQLAVIRGRIAEYKAKEKAQFSGFFDKL
jgi:tetratricopeptide (TPR) repeat protein